MLLQAVDSFSNEEVLAAVPTRSPDDVVFLTGSRTAGLGHATSDYDAFVITTPPVPRELVHGVMSRLGTASLDITYLIPDDLDSVARSLAVTRRSDVARLDWNDLDFAVRVHSGVALQNEAGFQEAAARFPENRLRQLIFVWEQTRALAAMLEAYAEAEAGPPESVWTCCLRAIVHGACAASAQHGQLHMNSKWVHEKCAKVASDAPDLLGDLLAIESRPVPDATGVPDLLDRSREFLETHVGLARSAFSSPLPNPGAIVTAGEMIESDEATFLVLNGWRTTEVGAEVADAWRWVSGEALDTPNPDALRWLERRGFVRFDWVSAAVEVMDGLGI